MIPDQAGDDIMRHPGIFYAAPGVFVKYIL